jgi:hypothetical protein
MRQQKLLLAASGFTCEFAGCRKNLARPYIERDVPPYIAHIVSAAPRGPRAIDDIPTARRNDAANLMSLCDDHHRLVDSRPDTYPASVLREMKADHEAWVAAQTNAGVRWSSFFDTVLYLNLQQLTLLAPQLVRFEGISLEALVGPEGLRALPPHITGAVLRGLTKVMGEIEPRAIVLTGKEDLTEQRIGSLFVFHRGVRARNAFDADGKPKEVVGDYAVDPQIYIDYGPFRATMPIDLRWAPSKTGLGMFRGSFTVLGIARLRIVNESGAVLSPLVLGYPGFETWNDMSEAVHSRVVDGSVT